MYANVLLTHQVIKSFKKRYETSKKRSAITFTSAMAAVAPVPLAAVYSATKIFTDYIAWGLGYELARYRVDVSSWRAAAVDIGNTTDKNIMVLSADNYVAQAFGKMTSGVHSGYLPHELLHLFWTNVNDVFPISLCQKFFNKMALKHKNDFKKAN